MGTILRIALRNLRANRRRTLLLGGAICLVTLLLVLTTSISNGIKETLFRATTSVVAGHVNVDGYYKTTPFRGALMLKDPQPVRRLIEKSVGEGQSSITARLIGRYSIVGPKCSRTFNVEGIDAGEERSLGQVLTITKGSLRALKAPRAALIFEKQAERLGLAVGDTFTIVGKTAGGLNNAVDVRVAAVAADLGRLSGFTLFVSIGAARAIAGVEAPEVSRLRIYLKDPQQADRVAAALRAALRAGGYSFLPPLQQSWVGKLAHATRATWVGQRLDVFSWREALSGMEHITGIFDGLTLVIVTLLLLITSVGVMNNLWIVIRKRTREIGTLRAIGMSRGRVLLLFLLEGAMLALGASLLGAALGCGAAVAIDGAGIALSAGLREILWSEQLRLVIATPAVIRSVVVITGLTTLFAFVPAYRATRLRPVTAIQQVG